MQGGPADPILVEGPWEHRGVYAHGQRFHVAVCGTGPLVLFLHGYPTFWWLWRRLLQPVADAGFTAVAMDLRGYGASDHPPRGYDPRTLASDVSGVIKALGHEQAIIVGQGWGGLIGWTVATLHGDEVRALVTVGAVHPNALRKWVRLSPAQARAVSYVVPMQRPRLAEWAARRHGARAIGKTLRSWFSGIDREVEAVYREAFLRGNTAYCAFEYYRWALRSLVRIDGRSFARLMRKQLGIPVLAIHGTADQHLLPGTAKEGARYASNFELQLLTDAGHLIPEEHPEQLAQILLPWLAEMK